MPLDVPAYRIETLAPKLGDVVVLELEEPLEAGAEVALRETLRRAFPDNLTIVIAGGGGLGILPLDELHRLVAAAESRS